MNEQLHEPPAAVASEVIDPRTVALVWIDARLARILRWRDGVVSEAIMSDVPPHVRTTAHVRHDPADRHGGSGRGQDDAERRRNEYLRAFLKSVAARLRDDERIEILGTGTVGERLATHLRRLTARRLSPPVVIATRSAWLSERQLAARLRERLGFPRTRAGAVTGPRRAFDKPPARDRG
ncbi:MAG TPA: hypothetical protein VLA59_03910 [Patescibacteria group bacterium]|nr:hypothetical protein [Patescibacteria group bacterium]